MRIKNGKTLKEMKDIEEVKGLLDYFIEKYGYETFVNAIVLLETDRVLTDIEYRNFLNSPTATILSISDVMDDGDIYG